MSSILIVEDDLRLALEWQAHLNDAGHETLVASQTTQARLLLEENPIDLCVVDFILKEPGVPSNSIGGSLVFTEEVRQFGLRVRRPIPIIGISGYFVGRFGVDPEQHFRSFMVADFLWKPFSASKLQERIEAILADESPSQRHEATAR